MDVTQNGKANTIFSRFLRFCIAAELFGQVDILDGQKTEIYVVVEG